MIRNNRADDAVSPVVGVMLMLAVTVMIAAVVSAFAGGFSDTGEKVPQTSFKVRVNLDENAIYFDHAGGDPLSLHNTRVAFIIGEQKATLSPADVGENCKKFRQVGDLNGTTIKAGDTFFIQGESLSSGRSGIRFGNLELEEEQEVTWMVIDTRSSKTVSMGSLYL